MKRITTNFKVYSCGNFIDYIHYEKPIRFGKRHCRRRIKKIVDPLSKPKPKTVSRFSISRSRTNIRRLINCNEDLNRFVTLTFREHITEHNKANYLFNRFIKRLKIRFPDLKYLAVPELTEIGRIHYHLLVNNFIKADVLADVWRNGFVKINLINNNSNVGAYVCKYLSADFANNFRTSKKRFFYSKNLIRPFLYLGHKAINHLKYFKPVLHKMHSKSTYGYLGRVDFNSFHIGDPKTKR